MSKIREIEIEIAEIEMEIGNLREELEFENDEDKCDFFNGQINDLNIERLRLMEELKFAELHYSEEDD